MIHLIILCGFCLLTQGILALDQCDSEHGRVKFGGETLHFFSEFASNGDTKANRLGKVMLAEVGRTGGIMAISTFTKDEMKESYLEEANLEKKKQPNHPLIVQNIYDACRGKLKYYYPIGTFEGMTLEDFLDAQTSPVESITFENFAAQMVLMVNAFNAERLHHKSFGPARISVMPNGGLKLFDTLDKPQHGWVLVSNIAPEACGGVWTEASEWFSLGQTMLEILLQNRPKWTKTENYCSSEWIYERQGFYTYAIATLRAESREDERKLNALNYISSLLTIRPEQRTIGLDFAKLHPMFTSVDWELLGQGKGFVSESEFKEFQIAADRVPWLKAFHKSSTSEAVSRERSSSQVSAYAAVTEEKYPDEDIKAAIALSSFEINEALGSFEGLMSKSSEKEDEPVAMELSRPQEEDTAFLGDETFAEILNDIAQTSK